jgi:hypothetical protein
VCGWCEWRWCRSGLRLSETPPWMGARSSSGEAREISGGGYVVERDAMLPRRAPSLTNHLEVV